jgi:hypothetical protein
VERRASYPRMERAALSGRNLYVFLFAIPHSRGDVLPKKWSLP